MPTITTTTTTTTTITTTTTTTTTTPDWTTFESSHDLRRGFGKLVNAGHYIETHLFDSTYVSDPNHVQLIEEESVCILSSRETNAVLRIEITSDSSTIKWVMGGANGTMDLYDDDGTLYEPGTLLFTGQHNAEYFGDDQYYIFDDGAQVCSRHLSSVPVPPRARCARAHDVRVRLLKT